MTPAELEAIRARNAARTPGRWYYHNRYGHRGEVFANKHDDHLSITDVDLQECGMDRACVRRADGVFIAHASEDIPALLAEVERLRRALSAAKIRLSYGDCENAIDAASSSIDAALRGEV